MSTLKGKTANGRMLQQRVNSKNTIYPKDTKQSKINNVFQGNGATTQDDREFNSSYCDYDSDIFKEQPSYNNISRYENEDQQHHNMDCDDELHMGLHFINNQDQIYSPPLSDQKTPSTFIDAESSLRLLQMSQNNGINYKQSGKQTPGDIRIVNQNMNTKSLERHKKQPPNTMIPQSINKNLANQEQNIQMVIDVSKQVQSRQSKSNSGLAKSSIKASTDQNFLLCEESELMTMLKTSNHTKNQQLQQFNSSNANLTPQKQLPVPISPSQLPILSNNTSDINIVSSKQIFQGVQIFNQQQKSELKQSRTAFQYSDTKPTVVYNEFKYFTSGNEINEENYKNYIHINSANANFSRKSDIIQGNGQQNVVYEMSPTVITGEHQTSKGIFDVSSPKHSVSATSTSQNQVLRANSLRKQLIQENYYQQLRHQDSSNSESPLQIPLQSPPLISQNSNSYENKIKELQDHIDNLEDELKISQIKNQEMQRRMAINHIVKDKSFVQSFDKNASRQNNVNKHLSDTEDSLLLSEKKNFKRSSHNNSKHICPKDASNSSIVDVKIRPIANLKTGQQSLYHRKNSSSISTNKNCHSQSEIQQPTDDTNQDNCDQQQMIMDYQVHNYNPSDKDDSQLNHQNEDETCPDDEGEEEECEGCERLKQLVFQAKEAIDDLKAEIEEWREISSEKETELRQLQHRLYNDLIGIDKKTGFIDDIQTKEFDPNRPPAASANNIDNKQKLIKNFIEQNKKKIKSRSKGRGQHHHSEKKSSYLSKRSNLKNIKETLNQQSSVEEAEFYQVEDQGIQTSFIQFDNNHVTSQDSNLNMISRNETQNNKSELRVSTGPNQRYYYGSNVASSQNLSPQKHDSQNQENLLMCSGLEEIQNPHGNEKLSLSGGNIEEVLSLKLKNQKYELEITQLKNNLDKLQKQCENFVQLAQRVKRKTKKSAGVQNVNIDDIKKEYQIVSSIESYSILEKIQEWKREEGLIDPTNPANESTPSLIPRPMKLIMDITQEEIMQKPKQQQMDLKSAPTGFERESMSPMSEFRNYIKQEQENLKKHQEQKFKELQKQQQEYLQFLRGQA